MHSTSIQEAAVSGRTVDLSWLNGRCEAEPAGIMDEREAGLQVKESKTEVHILLTIEPNPAAQPYLKQGVCFQNGYTSDTQITLAAPLGTRILYDDSTSFPTIPDTVTVNSVTTPIVLPILYIRLDPAGLLPATSASYPKLVAADTASELPGGEITSVVYGLFTDTGFADYGRHYPSEKLGAPPNRFSIRQLAVWVHPQESGLDAHPLHRRRPRHRQTAAVVDGQRPRCLPEGPSLSRGGSTATASPGRSRCTRHCG